MYLPKTYAIFCTRYTNFSETTENLVKFYRSCGIKVLSIIEAKSIFNGYKHALDSISDLKPEDIIILCHDDIDILLSPEYFIKVLHNELSKPNTGFIGPAGTTYLDHQAVWWDHTHWKNGKHSGLVFHGSLGGEKFESTYYGSHRPVVVLDGLFLACKYKTLTMINMDQPGFFPGNWDFYDIYYTFQAHQKGLINRAVPILMSHESFGNLAGRDSWHSNKMNFCMNYEQYLPVEIK